jgi:nitroreductase
VDTFLAIVSRREVRNYAARPVPADTEKRILEAGRISGSSMNRQPWRFIVVGDAAIREQLAESVYEPANVRGAGLVIAIAVRGKGPVSFDAGRATQNMLLAAWSEGVGACPNGMMDSEATGRLLGVERDERLVIVLTFGYPAAPREPGGRSPEEWLARANRRALDEIVTRL